ncbi:MAG: hypothetical protein A2W99_10215 [Bacteroidetes bacterium GWF2_33_16]|nr:MAG: hypothetical protein A2X00_05525 [Bacteroidetes bacterium GWE2_32_14]OFY03922.1 MAG: hypothetical protein A2W99_10215 [Bacteroidetes bacterium GWF2_33_16]
MNNKLKIKHNSSFCHSLFTNHWNAHNSLFTNHKKNSMKTQYIKNISLLIIAIILFAGKTQGQPDQKIWQWTTSLGSASWDYVNGIQTDSIGNIYVGGAISGDLTLNSKEYTSKGKHDMFVAKYNQHGKLQWIWSEGGKQSDKLTALHVTKGGEVLISGIVNGEAKIGKQAIEGNGRKLILAKISGKGQLIWLQKFEVENNASFVFISELENKEIIATGSFKKDLTLGELEIKSKGKEDIFIAHFTANGTIKQLKSFGSKGRDKITAFDSQNGILYLSGTFEDEFSIGNEKIEKQSKNGVGCFVAALNQEIDPLWVKSYANEQYFEISSLAPASNNELFIAGNFTHKAVFGNREISSKGSTDMYLAKLDKNGDEIWVNTYGSPHSDYANNIVLNPAGGIMLSGSCNDTLMLDTLIIANTAGKTTAFVSQINSNGEVFWVGSIGGNTDIASQHTTLDANGNIYLAGSFTNTLENSKYKISSAGNEDIFLAKYFNCPKYKDIITGADYLCQGTEADLIVKGSFDNVLWNNGLFNGNQITIREAGQYTVRMTDKNACLLRDTLDVRLAPSPLFSIGKDTSLFYGQSIMLEGPQNMDQYFWFNNTFFQSIEVGAKGNYNHQFDVWLEVTDTLNCQYSDSITISFKPQSPEIYNDQLKVLTVFPNPVSDVLHWSLSCDDFASLYAELTDNEGRLVIQQRIYNYEPSSEKTMNLGNLPAGVYYLNVGNANKKISMMVIKK